MYWGALSTDIKKSSVNWAGLSEWMQKAVQYHNKIIETVVANANKGNVEIKKLPNSPEGDAYTYYFTGDKDEVRRVVIRVSHDIQFILDLARKNKDGKLTAGTEDYTKCTPATCEKFRSKPYFGSIYIRIGIAFSEEAPIRYMYERYKTPTTIKFGVSTPSYRGGVIHMSEEAEKRADYDLKTVVNDKEKSKDIEVSDGKFNTRDLRPSSKQVATVKECYYELDDEGNPTDRLVFRNITEESPKEAATLLRAESTSIDDEKVTTLVGLMAEAPKIYEDWDDARLDTAIAVFGALQNYEPPPPKPVTGFSIFVQYKNVLTKALLHGNPYVMKYIKEEYKDIHKLANDAIIKFKANSELTGGLIKEKRDSNSMFVLTANGGDVAVIATDLYKEMAKLLSLLPQNSSIGIAYGEMKEQTGEYPDYFGDCVNLSARMQHNDWSYATKWGISSKNSHRNRLAFSSAVQPSTLVTQVIKQFGDESLPYTQEKIPRKNLNVGTEGTIDVLSTKLSGRPHYGIGDEITYTGKSKLRETTGIITEDNGFEVKIGDDIVIKKDIVLKV